VGLIGDVARTAVVAGTWAAVSNRVSRFQAGRWASENQSQSPRSAPTPGYVPPPPGRYQRPMFQPSYGAPRSGSPTVAPPPPPTPPADDMATRLALVKQLGELKAQGVLTDAEFDAQKRKILGD
jgi:hypothetical protein